MKQVFSLLCPRTAELGYHFMSVLDRHGTVNAEGSPEPLDSKWTASGREGGKSPVTFVPHVRESTPRCVGLKNISSAQKQAQYMPVQHTAHPNSPKVREGKREPDYLKLSKHAFAARPRKHWKGRGSIDFLNNLAAAAAPKFTKREARAKRLPLAGDAAGDLSSGGGG